MVLDERLADIFGKNWGPNNCYYFFGQIAKGISGVGSWELARSLSDEIAEKVHLLHVAAKARDKSLVAEFVISEKAIGKIHAYFHGNCCQPLDGDDIQVWVQKLESEVKRLSQLADCLDREAASFGF